MKIGMHIAIVIAISNRTLEDGPVVPRGAFELSSRIRLEQVAEVQVGVGPNQVLRIRVGADVTQHVVRSANGLDMHLFQ